jgi:integrin beta 1
MILQGYQPFSPDCGGVGTAKCGVCECGDFYFGRKCECDARGGARIDDDSGCRQDNTTDIICSGRGTCVCGQCDCYGRDNPLEVFFIELRKLINIHYEFP